MADTAYSSSTPKVSRYRSQRRAQLAQDQAVPPEVPQISGDDEVVPNDGVVRSQSRYHRNTGAHHRSNTTRPATAAEQDNANSPRRAHPDRYHSPTTTPARIATSYQEPRATSSSSGTCSQRAFSPSDKSDSLGRRVDSYEQDSEGDVGHSRYRGRQKQERVQTLHRQSPASPTSPLAVAQAPGHLFPPPRPEPVPHLDGAPSSARIRATKSTSALPKITDDEEGAGCFSLFRRRRAEPTAGVPEQEPVARPLTAKNEPMVIRPGGGGAVPGTDAPVSAVNAGDRQVLVECGKTRRVFPVTTATTPVDLIRSASIVMSERIDVHSAVLFEHFGTVGVQRPLRRYEHIRDVMNSWDTDKQNSLLLVDPGTGSSEAELSIAGVPRQKPSDKTWMMFYSQKVGKWETRHVTLKEDGQLMVQKDPEKPQQQENVCHLSDFDIYTPTQEKLKKKVKPPKRHCFAVKSQQKTIMFESTSNFVHFFSTGDQATADSFYGTLQSWRSWYLVNVMGEGNATMPEPAAVVQRRHTSADDGRKNKNRESLASHYELGSFQPLLEMAEFDKRRLSSFAPHPPISSGPSRGNYTHNSPASPKKQRSTNPRKQHPLGAMSNIPQLDEDEPLANLAHHNSSSRRRRPTVTDHTKATPATSEGFLSSGLLGRSYSQRRRDVGEREVEQELPWTTGPNLLNGNHNDSPKRDSVDNPRRDIANYNGAPQASGVDPGRRRSVRGSIDLHRSGSRAKEKPKPLIDLTPQYKEPPQHSNKGRGFQPSQVGPGGLIDNATSPDDPLGIPASTDWRARNTAPDTGRARADSRPGQSAGPSRSPVDAVPLPCSSGAFVEGGLLSTSHPSRRGGDRTGRGVMDGAHAKGPMLDIYGSSEFAQGSLLDRVEKENGGPAGPVIDREWDRRVERDMRYGEAA